MGRDFVFFDLDGDGFPELIVLGHVHRRQTLPIPTAIYTVREGEIVSLDISALYEPFENADLLYVAVFINTLHHMFAITIVQVHPIDLWNIVFYDFRIYLDGEAVGIAELDHLSWWELNRMMDDATLYRSVQF